MVQGFFIQFHFQFPQAFFLVLQGTLNDQADLFPLMPEHQYLATG